MPKISMPGCVTGVVTMSVAMKMALTAIRRKADGTAGSGYAPDHGPQHAAERRHGEQVSDGNMPGNAAAAPDHSPPSGSAGKTARCSHCGQPAQRTARRWQRQMRTANRRRRFQRGFQQAQRRGGGDRLNPGGRGGNPRSTGWSWPREMKSTAQSVRSEPG